MNFRKEHHTLPYPLGNLRPALIKRAIGGVDENGVEKLSLRRLARDLYVSHAAPCGPSHQRGCCQHKQSRVGEFSLL